MGHLRAYDLEARGARAGQVPCVRLVQNAHAADITCMAASRQLGLLVSGCAAGQLRVWDICSFDLVAQLAGHTSGITQVLFLGPAVLPLVVSSDSGGYVHVWAVRGSLYSDRLMLALLNTGRASGPSAPSLKVVDLAMLKSTEQRRRVAVKGQDGLMSMKTFAEEAKVEDADLDKLLGQGIAP